MSILNFLQRDIKLSLLILIYKRAFLSVTHSKVFSLFKQYIHLVPFSGLYLRQLVHVFYKMAISLFYIIGV